MKGSPPAIAVSPESRPRDRRIDLCYVIGILLVVAGHSGADIRFNSTALFRWIYAFHMPLFFALFRMNDLDHICTSFPILRAVRPFISRPL